MPTVREWFFYVWGFGSLTAVLTVVFVAANPKDEIGDAIIPVLVFAVGFPATYLLAVLAFRFFRRLRNVLRR